MVVSAILVDFIYFCITKFKAEQLKAVLIIYLDTACCSDCTLYIILSKSVAKYKYQVRVVQQFEVNSHRICLKNKIKALKQPVLDVSFHLLDCRCRLHSSFNLPVYFTDDWTVWGVCRGTGQCCQEGLQATHSQRVDPNSIPFSCGGDPFIQKINPNKTLMTFLPLPWIYKYSFYRCL